MSTNKEQPAIPAQLDAFANPPAPAPILLPGDDVVTEGDAGAWAVFSKDHVYRYLLGRVWEPNAPVLVVGMRNPSKVGGRRPDGKPDNDPTVTRCLGFARRDSFGGLVVWNAHALIATNPRELKTARDPYGPRNAEAIQVALRMALGTPVLTKAVIAWGRPANDAIRRALQRAFMTASSYRQLWRFGEPTKDGWPRHPLYLKSDTPIVRCTSYGPPMTAKKKESDE